MADRKPSTEKSDPKKKTGKFHYDPVGMSGKEAGKFKEHEGEGKQQEQTGNDGGDRLGRRKT